MIELYRRSPGGPAPQEVRDDHERFPDRPPSCRTAGDASRHQRAGQALPAAGRCLCRRQGAAGALGAERRRVKRRRPRPRRRLSGGDPLVLGSAGEPAALVRSGGVQEEVAMKWVTRERPVIDRIACPWLVTRFIDREAEFLFVPPADVMKDAEETRAIPYDVPGVELSHVGDGCSFDAFVAKYRLEEPALHELARIVRGADT